MLLAVYFLLGVNALGLLMIALDKMMSKMGMNRISERSILSVYLAGGWLGGLLAQYGVRHKTRKESFKAGARITIVLSIVMWSLALSILEEGAYLSW